MKINLLHLAIALSTTSCQVVISSILGVKQPTAINDLEAKNSFQSKDNIYSLYRIKEEKMDSLLHSEYKPGWGVGFKPIQFICFDRSGKVVAQWASCESGLRSYTFKTVTPRSKYSSNPALTIYTVASISKLLSSGKSSILEYSNYDFTYIVYQCIWTQKLSNKLLTDIEEYASKNHLSYNIILIDADYYNF